MKTVILALIGLGMTFTANVRADVFEAKSWTNKDGKVMEASIDHILSKDSLILRAKNGGKRYTIKTTSLSDESQKQLHDLIDETLRSLKSGGNISGDLLYKGIALNLTSETESAVLNKPLSLEVINYRLSSDKVTATLELESGLFAELKAKFNCEFFVLNKALSIRPKDSRGAWESNYWWLKTKSGAINKSGSPVVTKGDRWKFVFSDKVRITWGMVGVSDGPIITDK